MKLWLVSWRKVGHLFTENEMLTPMDLLSTSFCLAKERISSSNNILPLDAEY